MISSLSTLRSGKPVLPVRFLYTTVLLSVLAASTAFAAPQTPSITNTTTDEDSQSTSGLVISVEAGDTDTTHFKITALSSGSLYKTDGVSPIAANDFITKAEGLAGLKFTPAAGPFQPSATFDVQSSSSAADGGLDGDTVTATITITPIADTPSVESPTTDVNKTVNVTITRNANDGAEVTHYRISSISNGSLTTNGGASINNNDFIASAGATTLVKFTPDNDSTTAGSFNVQASTSSSVPGLGGSVVTSTITIDPVPDPPSVDSPTTDVGTQTTISITKNAIDGPEVTHYQITAISNGSLVKSDDSPLSNNDFITVAEGAAGVKFTPTALSTSNGSFDVQASLSATSGGLGGGLVTSTITVVEEADTPQITSTNPASTDVNKAVTVSLDRNAADTSDVTHFKIDAITNGTLSTSGGAPISNGDFLLVAEGVSGLNFLPALDSTASGSFTAQGSIADNDGGLGGGIVTATINIVPVADTPSVTDATTDEDHQSSSGLVISPNPIDGPEVTHFKITNVPSAAGVLYLPDGVSAIAEGDFVSRADGASGLRFTPRTDAFVSTANFTVQASLSNDDSGLGGGTDSATITVTAVADTMSITDASTQEDSFNSSGLVCARHPSDGAEVAFIHITNITHGVLYRNDESTLIADGEYLPFAEGELGLKFLPDLNSSEDGSFNVQASLTNALNGSGLGGSQVLARVFVSSTADTPSVSSTSTLEDTQTSSGLVIDRAASDGAEVSHFKITSISNGVLYQNDGQTAIADNEFISYAQGNAGLRFTPAADTNAAGAFFVQASTSNSDAGLGGSQVQAIITVEPVADTPEVTDATTDEDIFTSSGLVITRNAVDGTEITHFKISAISGGDLFQSDGLTAINNNDFITALQGNTGLKFKPAENAVVAGSFDVEASLSSDDAGLGGDPATATITINPVNDAPILDNSATFVLSSINEDTVDAAGDLVSALLRSDPNVTDAITDVDLTDPEGIAITVADSTNGQWQYALSGGAWQDFPLTLSPTTALLLGETDSIRFVPTQDYNGAIDPAITFQAWDQSIGSPGDATGDATDITPTSAFSDPTAPATASIVVRPVNDAPDAVADTVTTNESTAITIDVLDNDTDVENPSGLVVPATAFITIIADASHGATGITVDGQVSYSPDQGFYGEDSFVYRLTDRGEGSSNPPFTDALSDTAVVNITVLAVNDPPNAVDDTATTESGVEVLIDVLSNDNDAEDGENLNPAITIVSGPDPSATVSIDATTGVISYTPDAAYAGIDTLVYEVCDYGLEQDDPLPDLAPECSQATVRIAVSQSEITVSTLDDNDDGLLDPGEMSLREAMSLIAVDGEIDFAPGLFTPGSESTIALSLGGLTAQHGMTIIGPEASVGLLVLNGMDTTRILSIENGAVAISNLSLREGASADKGGAILTAVDTTLSLDAVMLIDNQALTTGGAIHNEGALDLRDCTVAGNTAGTFGGGLYSASAEELSLTNCTLSGNVAQTEDGGGLFVQAGLAQLSQCTLTLNSAVSAGGMRSVPDTSVILNSLIAGNTATAAVQDIEGIYTSLGNNLIGDPVGSEESWDESDLTEIEADTVLDMNLRVNGGSLLTHALLADSPAIDAGNSTQVTPLNLTTDQRGAGFDRINGTAVDIGAYEINRFVVDTLADAVPSDAGDGLLSLREALLLTYPGDIIEFSVSGSLTLVERLELDNGKPDVVASLGLIGPGKDQLSLDGGGATQILFIPSEDSDVFITDLSFANGFDDPADAARGGCAIYNFGTVRIQHCDLSENTATALDGGAVHNRGLMTMTDCGLHNNHADNLGGAVVNWGGDLSLLQCSLAENQSLDNGGAIANALGGALRLSDCSIYGNTAALGGAIHNASATSLDLSRCALYENTVSSDGGGVFNLGSVSLVNCTISGNTADRNGGGFHHALGEVSFTNCTITNNTCDAGTPLGFGDGGGLYTDAGDLDLSNTIVAGNFDTVDNAGTGNIHLDISGTVNSLGYNLIGISDGAGGVTDGVANDQVGLRLSPLDAGLSELADQGGLTKTHLLKVASSAIDAGDNSVVAAPLFGAEPFTDQRGDGFARILDGVGDEDALVDIGAVEFVSQSPSFSSTPVLEVDEDQPYEYQIVTSDNNLDELFEITTTDLPSWLTLTQTGNGAATLSGVPTNEDIAAPFDTRDFDIVLQVEDWAQQMQEQAFTITVTGVNDAPEPQDDSASTSEDVPVTIEVLDNDTDDDGALPPALVAVITPPQHGVALVDPLTGAIHYTPDEHYNGADSFEYQVTDDGAPLPALSAGAMVSITINAVNDAPFLTTDVVTMDEDQVAQIDVLANDSDVDGALIVNSLEIAIDPENGQVEVDTVTGLIRYTPDENYNGTDSFQYRVYDDGAPDPTLSSVATVEITINPINDAPDTVADEGTTDEDTAVTIDVLANDSDLDGALAPASVVVSSDPAHGQTSVNPLTGEITYTPDLNYNGSDSFEYAVTDDGYPLPALTSTAVVSLTVNAINDAPDALDDTATTDEDTAVLIDVLANDSDVDGTLTPSSVSVTSAPANGQTTVNPATGVISYTPNQDFNGADSFVYAITDNGSPLPEKTSTATASITVNPVNDAPALVTDAATTDEDTPVLVDVLANDSDVDGALLPATVNVVAGPANGSTTVDAATGAITYHPNQDFNGSDSFTYAVTDDGYPLPALTSTMTVNITINPVNDVPTPAPDAAVTDEDTLVQVDVLANDSDVDGTPVPASVIVVTPPNYGVTSVDAITGIISYTPNADYNGADSFEYQVSDDGAPLPALSATATVSLTINAVNDAPRLNDDSGETQEDEALSIDVLANDADVDGLLLPATVTVVSAPANGSTSVDPATGSITYTPNLNFNGTDSFSYQVSDDGAPLPALTSIASVQITINAVNDAPDLGEDSASTEEDTPVIVAVLANDTDVDGNLLPDSVLVSSEPEHGSTEVDPFTGAIRYTPDQDYYGEDHFKYYISDDGSPQPVLGSTAMVTLTVNPVNDAPLPLDDLAQTEEDTAVAIPVLDNDSDVDANLTPASVSVTVAPRHGATSVDPATGVITYTPDQDYNGSDGFTYQVSDDGYPLPSLSATATVLIDVGAVNDSLIANDDSGITEEDTPVTVDILANDTDVDGNPVPASVTVIEAPAHGSTQVNLETGAISYTPNTDYNGADSFVYMIDDDGAPLPELFDSATVSITVNAVNDAPLLSAPATADGFQEIELPVEGIVLSDVDWNESENAVLELSLTVLNGVISLENLEEVTISGGANGSASLTLRAGIDALNKAVATLRYTGNALYYGPENLEIRVNDLGNTGASGPLSDSATVAIVLVPTSMVVTTLEDEVDGDFSAGNVALREALEEIAVQGVITFEDGLSGTLTLAELQGNLVIDRSLRILGPGSGLITLSGGLVSQVLSVESAEEKNPIQVEISDLTFADGNAGTTGLGGAIRNAGQLALFDCKILGSRAGDGGGVHNSGALHMERCTGAGNSAESAGGFITSLAVGSLKILDSTITANAARHGGGVMSLGAVAMSNVTLSGNLATDNGGALYHGAQQEALLTNCTVTANVADQNATSSGNGGGIYTLSGAQPVNLRNCLVAGNMDMSSSGVLTGAAHPDVSGVFVGNQHNLIGDDLGAVGFEGSDLVLSVAGPVDIDTVLESTLADNGGPTLTHALVLFSPAINQGDNAFVTASSFIGPPFYDQRGSGFDRIIRDRVDAGAVEFTSDAPALTVRIVSVADQATLTGFLDMQFDVFFSETVEGFGPEDILNEGSAGGVVFGVEMIDVHHYRVSVLSVASPGSIIPTIRAGAVTDSWNTTNPQVSNEDEPVNYDPELDSDNDGVIDAEEGKDDPDNDGVPNYLDEDSDNDGVNDRDEATVGGNPYDFGEPDNALLISQSAFRVDESWGDVVVSLRQEGHSDIYWNATVVEGGAWAAISGAASGNNDGVLSIHYDENLAEGERSAVVRINAPVATGFPVDIRIDQSACVLPGAPANMSATDLKSQGVLLLEWNAAANAVSYEVHSDLDGDTLLALVETPFYEISTNLLGLGCTPEVHNPNNYRYWVIAVNDCGASAPSNATQVAKSAAYETVLPSSKNVDGLQVAQCDSRLAIRLRSVEAIDPQAIYGMVSSEAGVSEVVDWNFVGNAENDIWLSYQPDAAWIPGEVVTMTVGAQTLSGASLGPLSYVFQIESHEASKLAAMPLAQPQAGQDYADDQNADLDTGEVWLETDSGAEATGFGVRYQIGADALFEEAQRFWLPLPEGLDPNEAMIYYRLDSNGEVRWEAGDQIEGWLASDDFLLLDLEGVTWFGFSAHHGATVQIGEVSEMDTAKLQSSVLPANLPLGDLLVLSFSLMLMAGFVLPHRRRLARVTNKRK